MDDQDDVTETVLSGEAYARAALSTRRFYPLGLRSKVLFCILTVASTILLAPATYARRDLIGSLEGDAASSGAIEPSFSTIALAGVVSTSLCAILLLRFLWLVETDALSVEQATEVVRIEEAILTVAISTGTIIVVASVTLALIGLLAPNLAVALYDSGVQIYVQAGGLFGVDTQVTSGLAVAITLVFLLLYLLITGEGERRRAAVPQPQ
jgi:hypothetical protein